MSTKKSIFILALIGLLMIFAALEFFLSTGVEEDASEGTLATDQKTDRDQADRNREAPVGDRANLGSSGRPPEAKAPSFGAGYIPPVPANPVEPPAMPGTAPSQPMVIPEMPSAPPPNPVMPPPNPRNPGR